MKTISSRLTDGQDLLTEIQRLVDTNHIQAGVVLSAVGSLRTSKIRVPVIDDKVKYIEPQNLEIDTLQGTVSVNGCHVHISVSDIDGNVFGGHVKPGCIVRTTCELVIGILENTIFERQPDADTGFDELIIDTIT